MQNALMRLQPGHGLQRRLHVDEKLRAGAFADDSVERGAFGREELHRRVATHLEVLADLRLGVGVDQYADEALREVGDLRLVERFVSHLVAILAPAGGKE